MCDAKISNRPSPTPPPIHSLLVFFLFLKKPPYKFYLLPLHEHSPHPIAVQNMNIPAANHDEGRHISRHSQSRLKDWCRLFTAVTCHLQFMFVIALCYMHEVH